MFLIICLSFGTGELRSFVSVDLPEGIGRGPSLIPTVFGPTSDTTSGP